MSRSPLALSIDCGTQSLRAIVFNTDGEPVATESVRYDEPYYSQKNGWAEQDPEFWWDAAVRGLSGVSEQLSDEQRQSLVSICISCLRDTYICLDDKKRILRPAIVWPDQRVAKDRKKIPFHQAAIFAMVGMTEVIRQQRKVTRTVWLEENEPGTFRNLAHYVSLECWLNYKLTGNLIDSKANLCGHIPVNYKNGTYRRKGSLMWAATPVDPALLPPAVEVGETIGTITDAVAQRTGLPGGLKVVAGATDKACETLGCGVLESDLASVSFGTTATVEITTDRYVEPQRFLPAYISAVRGHWNPEVQIYRGYWMVRWFAEQFGQAEKIESRKTGIPVEQLLDRLLEQTPPGCDGMVLQPYWCPGLKQLEAHGSIIGLSDYHTRAHLYRAILEGINYELLQSLEGISARSHEKIQAICLCGGGSRSDSICQLACDVFGLPAYRCHTAETSALGAAIISFMACGQFASYEDAVRSMVHYTTSFLPDEDNHRLYRRTYESVYKNLYPALRPVYRRSFGL